MGKNGVTIQLASGLSMSNLPPTRLKLTVPQDALIEMLQELADNARGRINQEADASGWVPAAIVIAEIHGIFTDLCFAFRIDDAHKERILLGPEAER